MAWEEAAAVVIISPQPLITGTWKYIQHPPAKHQLYQQLICRFLNILQTNKHRIGAEEPHNANILFTSQVWIIGLSVIKGHNTSPVMDAGHSTAQVRVMGQYVSPQNTFVCPCYVRCCGNEVILEIGFLFHTPDQRPSDTWLSSISRFHIVRKCIPFQKFFICSESIQFEPHISNNRSNVKRIDII